LFCLSKIQPCIPLANARKRRNHVSITMFVVASWMINVQMSIRVHHPKQ
jgi:hypothetical protein